MMENEPAGDRLLRGKPIGVDPEGTVSTREDIGGDESYFSMVSRLGKEFLGDSLGLIRRNALHYDVAMVRSQMHADTLSHIMEARLADKMATAQGRDARSGKHDDLAADRVWNPDEVAYVTQGQSAQINAILTTLTTALTELQKALSSGSGKAD